MAGNYAVHTINLGSNGTSTGIACGKRFRATILISWITIANDKLASKAARMRHVNKIVTTF